MLAAGSCGGRNEVKFFERGIGGGSGVVGEEEEGGNDRDFMPSFCISDFKGGV